jgi:hypothetical protein
MAKKKGGQPNNTNAEKWTVDEALLFIESVHSYNLTTPNNYVLGLALIECGGYPDLWAYLGDKFIDNHFVFRAIKKAESFLEARIINSTISGDAKSAAMAIFYLKNKHGYRDSKDIQHSTPDGVSSIQITLDEAPKKSD